MSERSEIIYADGLHAKRGDKAPDHVLVNISFKTEEFKEFLDKNTGESGYCNVEILRSKKGNIYGALNQWTPNSSTQSSTPAPDAKPEEPKDNMADIEDDDLPF